MTKDSQTNRFIAYDEDMSGNLKLYLSDLLDTV